MAATARALLVPLGILVLVVVVVQPWLRGSRVAEPPGGQARAPTDVYDPVAAGEQTPPGFRQLLSRDGIRPIYEPVHVEAEDIDWDDDTLVIGVALDGEARAYPVQALNRREMVNDRLGDTLLLATW
jgi:hypothetical protein